MHSGVYVRSIYFQDPDGILLEFACWMRKFNLADVSHTPARVHRCQHGSGARAPERAHRV